MSISPDHGSSGSIMVALHAGCQRTDLDFVMYLDDDSYLNVPRLLSLLEVA